MLLPLKNLLTPQELQTAQSLLGEDAPWIDGRSSAGGGGGGNHHQPHAPHRSVVAAVVPQ